MKKKEENKIGFVTMFLGNSFMNLFSTYSFWCFFLFQLNHFYSLTVADANWFALSPINLPSGGWLVEWETDDGKHKNILLHSVMDEVNAFPDHKSDVNHVA